MFGHLPVLALHSFLLKDVADSIYKFAIGVSTDANRAPLMQSAIDWLIDLSEPLLKMRLRIKKLLFRMSLCSVTDSEGLSRYTAQINQSRASELL